MKKIKLVALDVDGTLLNSANEITERNLKAIKKAKKEKIRIVLVTGRPLKGVLSQIAKLNIFSKDDYIITINGAVISTIDGKIILKKEVLTSADCQEVAKQAQALHSSFQLVSAENIYTLENPISPYSVFDAGLTGMPLYTYSKLEDILAKDQIIKIMFLAGKEQLTQTIQKLPVYLKKKYTMIRTLDYYYEFLKKNVSKGSALATLAKHLGINKDQIIAVGDNENDISMIQYAGLGVAMGNADQLVQESADVVTLSNDEDGVAEVFNNYVFGKKRE